MQTAPPERVKRLIERAVKLAGGNDTALGRALGVSQNCIWQAKDKGRVSPILAAKIDEFTEGKVPKHLLRPDLFDAPQSKGRKTTNGRGAQAGR